MNRLPITDITAWNFAGQYKTSLKWEWEDCDTEGQVADISSESQFAQTDCQFAQSVTSMVIWINKQEINMFCVICIILLIMLCTSLCCPFKRKRNLNYISLWSCSPDRLTYIRELGVSENKWLPEEDILLYLRNWCQFCMNLSCYWSWILLQHCQSHGWHKAIAKWICRPVWQCYDKIHGQ